MSFADEVKITPREFLAGTIAAVAFCGSLAFGYGVKTSQIQELSTIVARHDAAIIDLTRELTSLRLTIAELNGNLSVSKGNTK